MVGVVPVHIIITYEPSIVTKPLAVKLKILQLTQTLHVAFVCCAIYSKYSQIMITISFSLRISGEKQSHHNVCTQKPPASPHDKDFLWAEMCEDTSIANTRTTRFWAANFSHLQIYYSFHPYTSNNIKLMSLTT